MSTASVVNSSVNVSLSATPNNYGVTHISLGSIPDNVAWSKAVLVRKYSGYPQNIYDGNQIYSIDNKNLIVKVDTVSTSSTPINKITAITPLTSFTSPETLTTSDIILGTTPIVFSGISIGSSVGKDSTFTFSSTAVASVTPVDTSTTGGGFAVSDLVTVKISKVTESSQPNEYGLSGHYHVYDTLGTNNAVSQNPGIDTASIEAQKFAPTKAYYALFLQYAPDYAATQSNTGKLWKKAGEVSSIIVKDTGTADNLAAHLPKFYIRESQAGETNDLLDFLKLFAFQLDVYKTQALNVFYSTNVTTADEELLKLLLKQFGVPFSNVVDISQARTLAANIVKIYKESGSLVGLKTLIEAYTGYGSNITAGRNYFPDYNSSSFEESTDSWVMGNSFGLLSRVGPIDTGTIGTSSYTFSAYEDSKLGYNGLGPEFIVTSATNSTLVATTELDSRIKPGQAVSVVAGAGAFSTGTFITSVDYATNTVKLNKPVSTSLATATVRVSTNLVSGMAKLVGSSTVATTVTMTMGPKKATTTATATATTAVSITPPVASVEDYVINPNVPYGTYVVSSTTTSGTQNLVLSKSVTLTSGSAITFSRNAAEKIGALSTYIPVETGKPYSFRYFVNSGTAISGATTGTANANIEWYDRKGSLISTSVTGTTTVSTASSTTMKWLPVSTKEIAPANAVYASPKITVNNVLNTTAWYLDSAQFDYPLEIIKKQVVTATTARVVTSIPHNYSITRPGTSDPTSVLITGVGAPFDGTFNIYEIDTPTSFKYTISSTSTTAEVTATGYVVGSANFEDARKVTIDILPNRINLVTNPSFESSTNFWGTSVSASTGAGVNCSLTSTTAAGAAVAGTKALQMSTTSDGNISVFGYSGTIVNKIITNYTTPFVIEPSVAGLKDIYYALSLYTKADTTPRDVYVEIYWYKDAAGTLPSDINVKSVGSTIMNSTSSWTRYSVIAQSPSDAQAAVLEVHVVGAVAGEKHFIDSVLFEKSYTLNPYFDGSFDGQNYTADRDSMWELEGIANSSRSYLYLNRVGNSGRLVNIITDGLYYG